MQPTKQRQEEGSVIVVIRANAGKLIVVPTSQLLQINEEKANICANSAKSLLPFPSISSHSMGHFSDKNAGPFTHSTEWEVMLLMSINQALMKWDVLDDGAWAWTKFSEVL